MVTVDWTGDPGTVSRTSLSPSQSAPSPRRECRAAGSRRWTFPKRRGSRPTLAIYLSTKYEGNRVDPWFLPWSRGSRRPAREAEGQSLIVHGAVRTVLDPPRSPDPGRSRAINVAVGGSKSGECRRRELRRGLGSTRSRSERRRVLTEGRPTGYRRHGHCWVGMSHLHRAVGESAFLVPYGTLDG
jgi:hypothetical protein